MTNKIQRKTLVFIKKKRCVRVVDVMREFNITNVAAIARLRALLKLNKIVVHKICNMTFYCLPSVSPLSHEVFLTLSDTLRKLCKIQRFAAPSEIYNFYRKIHNDDVGFRFFCLLYVLLSYYDIVNIKCDGGGCRNHEKRRIDLSFFCR